MLKIVATVSFLFFCTSSFAQSWLLGGNTIGSGSSNFGSLDNKSVYFMANGTTQMTIRAGGKIGIGTSSPAGKLHIDFNSSSTQPQLMLTENENDYVRINLKNNSGTSFWSISAFTSNINADERMNFSNTVGGNILVLTGNGKVGIGTNAPTYPLTVVSVSPNLSTINAASNYYNADNSIINSTYTGTTSSSVFKDVVAIRGTSKGGNNQGIGGYFESNYEGIFVNASTPSLGYPTSVYGVRANASNDAEDFSAYGVYATVSGGINAYGIYAEGGAYGQAAYFNGSVFSTTGFFTSDERLKKNIEPVTNAIEQILTLKPSTYNFRVDEFPTLKLPVEKQYGLIAQDLEKQFPELVKTARQPATYDQKTRMQIQPAVDYKTINYNGLIPVLIAGMQEQQQQIANQQAEIEDLKAQIAAIKNSFNPAEDPTPGIGKQILKTDESYIDQNVPNPFDESTTISYYIPSGSEQAVINILSPSGTIVKTYALKSEGKGELVISTSTLKQGIYYYSLLISGKTIDTKKIISTH